MKKSLLERLMDAKHEYDVANYAYFNNGIIRKDENYSAKRINNIDNIEQFASIENVLCDATRSYARQYKFDSIDMNLLLGLIFDSKDIDENAKIKEGAEPIQNVVRYYTGSITSQLDGEKTNSIDFGNYGVGSQGYINFNQLISLIKESELEYNGPETFKEFEKDILTGIPFDITLSAKFIKKEEQKEFSRTR